MRYMGSMGEAPWWLFQPQRMTPADATPSGQVRASSGILASQSPMRTIVEQAGRTPGAAVASQALAQSIRDEARETARIVAARDAARQRRAGPGRSAGPGFAYAPVTASALPTGSGGDYSASPSPDMPVNGPPGDLPPPIAIDTVPTTDTIPGQGVSSPSDTLLREQSRPKRARSAGADRGTVAVTAPDWMFLVTGALGLAAVAGGAWYLSKRMRWR